MIDLRLRRLPRVITVLGSILLVSGILTHGAAADTIQARQRVVRFADLDLNQQTDAETLYRRIKAAAREVCRSQGILAGLPSARTRECTRETTEQALAVLDEPALDRVRR